MRSSARSKQYEFYYSFKKNPKNQFGQNRLNKAQFIKIFNKIKKKYNYISVRLIKVNGNKISISQNELFVELELTMRYYNEIKKDNKIWFLNPYDDYILKNKFDIKY